MTSPLALPDRRPPSRRYLATAGAMLLLLVMAAITWYSNSASDAALDAVIERNVKPLMALQAIDRQVKEVRFRVAGVILDQMPAPGSRQHLAEARLVIPAAWDEYRRATAASKTTADEDAAIARLQHGFAELTRIFDKLDKAYAADDDKKELVAILEDDWPLVTTEVIKPMNRLIAIRDENVAAAYAASHTLGGRLNVAAIVMTALLGFLAVRILRQPELLRREVERRTRDLRAANERLEAEIAERLRVEQALRDSEGALERRVAERTADLTAANEALKRLNRELEETHGQLLQSEKMASIGQLAAGVAHEINNPIGFVNSNLGSLQHYFERLLNLTDAYAQADTLLPPDSPVARAVADAKQQADLEFLREDAVSLLRESLDGVGRVKRIVQDLKNFSHVDSLDWQEADLHRGLDSTLNVVWHELKYKADIVKQYGELPPVECMASQINQVFMNLLVNAAQAIEERGTITIRTGVDEGSGRVRIEIADTGRGIAPECLPRIFDPFFTTKPVGQGTGLGLSISYGIVRKHGGSIEAFSEPGKGSTFRIELPTRRESAAD